MEYNDHINEDEMQDLGKEEQLSPDNKMKMVMLIMRMMRWIIKMMQMRTLTISMDDSDDSDYTAGDTINNEDNDSEEDIEVEDEEG